MRKMSYPTRVGYEIYPTAKCKQKWDNNHLSHAYAWDITFIPRGNQYPPRRSRGGYFS